jgi:hypothetical protein
VVGAFGRNGGDFSVQGKAWGRGGPSGLLATGLAEKPGITLHSRVFRHTVPAQDPKEATCKSNPI